MTGGLGRRRIPYLRRPSDVLHSMGEFPDSLDAGRFAIREGPFRYAISAKPDSARHGDRQDAVAAPLRPWGNAVRPRM